MTWLYVVVAFLNGVLVGMSLWQWWVMPALERKHLAELNLVTARARLQLLEQRRAMEASLRAAWRWPS